MLKYFLEPKVTIAGSTNRKRFSIAFLIVNFLNVLGSTKTPSKPYRAACHLFDWSICIWVSGIGSALIKTTTRAWIKATIAIISL